MNEQFFNEYYDYLVNYGICSQDAISIALHFNEKTVETLLEVLHYFTGFHNFEQFFDSENDYPDEVDYCDDDG